MTAIQRSTLAHLAAKLWQIKKLGLDTISRFYFCATKWHLHSLHQPHGCMYAADNVVPCLFFSVSGKQGNKKEFDFRQVFYSRTSMVPSWQCYFKTSVKSEVGLSPAIPTDVSESFSLLSIYLFIHICLFAYFILSFPSVGLWATSIISEFIMNLVIFQNMVVQFSFMLLLASPSDFIGKTCTSTVTVNLLKHHLSATMTQFSFRKFSLFSDFYDYILIGWFDG